MSIWLKYAVVILIAFANVAMANDNQQNQPEPVIVLKGELVPRGLAPDKVLNENASGNNEIILNKHDLLISYFKTEKNGKLSFLPFLNLKGKDQHLTIYKDYVHYKETNNERLGILLRIEASVNILDADFELNNFNDIGAAAQLGRVRGRVHVKAYGVDGPDIYKLLIDADMTPIALVDIQNQINQINSKLKVEGSSLVIHPVALPEKLFELHGLTLSKKIVEERAKSTYVTFKDGNQ